MSNISGHAIDTWFWCQTPCSLAWGTMGNHVGPFSWASDWSEGQEMGGGAVGGQGPLQGVKLLIWIWHLILVSNPMFFGIGNHGESYGTICVSLRSFWRSRTGFRDCRRPRTSSRSEIINLVLNMLETWFWCQTSCFLTWGIMWDHFCEPQLDLKVKNKVEGPLEVKNVFMKRNYYFVSEHARDLI